MIRKYAQQIKLVRYTLTLVLVTTSLILFFQNCAPMTNLDGTPPPIGSDKSLVDSPQSAANFYDGAYSGSEYVNTCGDDPDTPNDQVCAMWYSFKLNGFISVVFDQQNGEFHGDSSCYTFAGAFRFDGPTFVDRKNITIVPTRFVVTEIQFKETSGCSPSRALSFSSKINELRYAGGLSFSGGELIGIETPSGRLLVSPESPQ